MSITCDGSALYPASYRGVGFWVESDKEDYGRRVITHEYPMSDDPEHEDLGEKAQKFSVTGYVVGDFAIAQKEEVVAACRAEGPAILQLPAMQAIEARCLSLSVTRHKDEQSYFKLHMEFVAEAEGVDFLPVSIFESLIGSTLLEAVDALTFLFEETFRPTDVLPFVYDNAVSRIVYFASDMLSYVEGIDGATQTALTASITTDIIGLAQNAEALVRPGPTDPPSSRVITTLGDIFYNVLAAYAPGDLIAPLKALASYTYLEDVDARGRATYGGTGTLTTVGLSGTLFDIANVAPSASKLADENNAAAFNGAVRSFALIALASALAAYTFPDRRSAVQARADLVELFNEQLERVTDENVFDKLQTARNYAVKSITSNMANLASVVTVAAPTSLPVLYWAARLYGDPMRALELVDRNDVASPAFMPRSFQALSS